MIFLRFLIDCLNNCFTKPTRNTKTTPFNKLIINLVIKNKSQIPVLKVVG